MNWSHQISRYIDWPSVTMELLSCRHSSVVSFASTICGPGFESQANQPSMLSSIYIVVIVIAKRKGRKTMELLQLLSSPAVGTHILTKGMNCISFLRRDWESNRLWLWTQSYKIVQKAPYSRIVNCDETFLKDVVSLNLASSLIASCFRHETVPMMETCILLAEARVHEHWWQRDP